ncbi:uncharacterized protein IL334_004224 [Kwoniella shivajii]|uniref:Cell wall protein n=1 Tax=Kwoniella shivajii TaxID=564305 RepID=A0ABZ1D3S8_9TREE|nr:hypothetical protein IL334_004224 [Kwoniella shivajii]
MIFNLETVIALSALVALGDARTLGDRAGGKIGDVLAGGYVNNITVQADNVVQCSQATISWTGTTGSVSLSIGQGGYYVGSTPIQNIDSISSGSYDWEVDQPSGEDLIFQVTDSSGQTGYIQNIKVGGSTDNSCLSQDDSTSTSTSSSSSSPAAASASPSASSANDQDQTSTAGANGVGVGSESSIVNTSSGGGASSTSAVPSSTSKSKSTKSKTSSSKFSSSTFLSTSTSSAVGTASASASAPTLVSAAAAATASSSTSSSNNAPLAAASGGSSTSSASAMTKLNSALGSALVGALVVGGGLIL